MITVIQPPTSPTTKDTEELEKLLQEPDYSLPIDSLIQVSTHETKWIEDSIDPLSKIIADGRTAEEREILEKSKKITLTLEERDKELSEIRKDFPEAQKITSISDMYTNVQEIHSKSPKTGLQNELNASQQLGNTSERGLTLIDLSGNPKNNGERENVNLALNKATPKTLPVPMVSSQTLNTGTGHQNEPPPSKIPPEMFPTPPIPPGPPPTFAEAFVASQHGHRLIEALPYFSEELLPLTLSGQQGRLMGIGLEQNSETAFAEFALGDVQLTLNLNNELVPLEGEAYIMLRYPRDDHRPWNALVSSRPAAPSARNSPNPAIGSFSDNPNPDPIPNRSDQISVNPATSTINDLPSQPFKPTPDVEPGAPDTAPALFLQKTPLAASSDNEDQEHILTVTSSERDRLVAPVLSRSPASSLTVPSSPVLTPAS